MPVGLRWHRQGAPEDLRDARPPCRPHDPASEPSGRHAAHVPRPGVRPQGRGRRRRCTGDRSVLGGADEHREHDEREADGWRVEAFALLRTVLTRVSEGGQEEYTARARLGHALLNHGSPDEQREGLELLADAVAQTGGLTPIERCEMAWASGRAAAELGERERAAELYKPRRAGVSCRASSWRRRCAWSPSRRPATPCGRRRRRPCRPRARLGG
jgi:hypothetical protein